MEKNVFRQNASKIPIRVLDIIIIIGIAAMAILIPVLAENGEASKTEDKTEMVAVNNE